MNEDELREAAFDYWAHHYGNLVSFDRTPIVMSGEHIAFNLSSNYPHRVDKKLAIIKMPYLGEIVLSISDGALVTATPRDIVDARIRKELERVKANE